MSKLGHLSVLKEFSAIITSAFRYKALTQMAEGNLKAVFRVYQMDYPEYIFHDTLTASRRHFGRCLPNHQLHTVAAACGYDLVNHHHALADAQACAAIAMKLFQNL